MDRNGYWVRRDIFGKLTCLLKVENDYMDSIYENGGWRPLDKSISGLGMDDDWSKVSEERAEELKAELDAE